MIKFKMPFNWDIALIGSVAQGNSYKLYSRFNYDLIGGMVDGFLLPDFSEGFLKECLQEMDRYHLEFEYLLNAPSMENIEYNPEGQKQIINFLKTLQQIGVHHLSIGNATLIHFILNNFKNEFSISASLNLDLMSVEQIYFYESLGLSEIELTLNHNRDFILLKELKKHCQIPLVLTVNALCAYYCPFSIHHAICLGHSAQIKHKDENFIDYYLLKCRKEMTSTPWKIIQSCWIRPEDLQKYSSLGYHHFKINDILRNSNWIQRVLNAYNNKSYQGNLLDLIAVPFDYEKNMQKNIQEQYLQLLVNPLITDREVDYINVASSDPIYPFVDNQLFPENFIDHFENNDCYYHDCDDCQYCRKIADQVMCYPSDYQSNLNALNIKYAEALKSFLEA